MTDVDEAAKIIRAGGVVAFPTETVYGLGCDATNEEATSKIFDIKGRPSFNPLIVHVSSIEQARSIGEFNDNVLKLTSIWPAPLTIVMNLNPTANIAKSVLAGLGSVAIRMPAHPIALELITKSSCPIAAPSANPSGYISATEMQHVLMHFGDQQVFILGGDKVCQYGLESTIIDTTGEVPTILRYGFITPLVLESILGKKVKVADSIMQIKAPGMLNKHYSPRVPLRLNSEFLNKGEIGLNFGQSKLNGQYSLNLSEKGDLIEAASNLYSMMRILDNYAVDNRMQGIAIAKIPNEFIGLAINDRIKRAANL